MPMSSRSFENWFSKISAEKHHSGNDHDQCCQEHEVNKSDPGDKFHTNIIEDDLRDRAYRSSECKNGNETEKGSNDEPVKYHECSPRRHDTNAKKQFQSFSNKPHVTPALHELLETLTG